MKRGHPYLRFFARRLGAFVLVVWVVEIATFLMVRLIPGDPARLVLGPRASQHSVEALHERLGLNEPLLTQYWHYTVNVLHFNFGESFTSHVPVSTELSTRLGNEIELIGVAVALVLVLGVGLGM